MNLTSLAAVLAQTVVPVAVVIAVGWLIGRRTQVEASALAMVGVKIFTPALLLANIPYDLSQAGTLTAVLMAQSAVMLLMGWLLALLLRETDRDRRTSLMMAVGLSNFGFLGLPLVRYAFGPAAEASALLNMTLLNVPTGIVAAFLASPSPSLGAALKHTAREPLAVTVVVVCLLGLAGVHPPEPLLRSAQLLGAGAVPLMLLVMGITMARIEASDWLSVPVVLSSGARLLLAPVVLVWVAMAAGQSIHQQPYAAALVQLATPTGVTPLMFLAAQQRRADLLVQAILVSMALSFITLPVVIAYAQGAF